MILLRKSLSLSPDEKAQAVDKLFHDLGICSNEIWFVCRYLVDKLKISDEKLG